MTPSLIFNWIQRPGFPGHFFALLCGALLPLSFAPYYFFIIPVISICFFYFSLKQLTPKQAMWRGWWFGLGVFSAGVSWVYVSIHIYSHTPWALASLMTLFFVASLAWFFALMTWVFQKYFSRKPLPYLAFAILWMLFEWTRSWFLNGFPWLFVGDAFVNTPLTGLAPVFGVYSISILVAFWATFLVDWQWKMHPKQGAAFIVAPIIIATFLSFISWTQPIENGDIQVVAIQANIPQERKWLAEEIYPTLEKYRTASEANWDSQLILWPETAITVLHNQAQEYLKFLDDEGKANNTALITGIPYQQGQDEAIPGAYHNSILALGEGSGIYHKKKLVPFGEYLPLPESWRSLLTFFNIPMSEFRPGAPAQPLLSISSEQLNYQVAPFICYDIVYPDYVASQAKDSGLLITISNDAWFGYSNGPLQHLGIVRMRAIENGRYVLRSTNTGITALIDPQGKIVDSLPQFKYGVLKTQAQVMTGNTPFNIWGSYPIIIFGMLVLIFIYSRKKSAQ